MKITQKKGVRPLPPAVSKFIKDQEGTPIILYGYDAMATTREQLVDKGNVLISEMALQEMMTGFIGLISEKNPEALKEIFGPDVIAIDEEKLEWIGNVFHHFLQTILKGSD